MKELCSSPFFGLGITMITFSIGVKVKQKTNSPFANPLVIAILMIISVLLIFDIPLESYQAGGNVIGMFLGPATACLAVSIYHKRKYLKKCWLPILVGCTCGVVTSIGSIYLMSKAFGLSEEITIALIPKSVTMPIALGVTESHGGLAPFTIGAVVLTGIIGNLFVRSFIKIFKVDDPMAAGLAIGACSHAVGTSKAIEIGETQGAMSGLAIGLCGIITVFLSLFL